MVVRREDAFDVSRAQAVVGFAWAMQAALMFFAALAP